MSKPDLPIEYSEEYDAEVDKIVEAAPELELEPKKKRKTKAVTEQKPAEINNLQVQETEVKKAKPRKRTIKPKIEAPVGEIVIPPEVKIVEEVPKPQEILSNVPAITAQDILTKSEQELKAQTGMSKRETNNLLQQLRIITTILLGKKSNKELSQTLQMDKSFASKQVRELEEQGLVKKESEGREVRYEVDQFNLMKLLQSKIVIKWKKEGVKKKDGSE